MMTYVVSNLHGHTEAFHRLLDLIRFSERRDVMYILGDTVDLGPDSVGLINDLSVRSNVYPIAGEHDFRAAKMLSGYQSMMQARERGEAPDPDFVEEFTAWISEGGAKTVEAYRELPDDDAREGVLDYLSDMPFYEEININGIDYLLLHCGIYDFTPDMELDWLEPDDFFSEAIDPTQKYFENKTVIVGHTPTTEDNGGDGRIFYGNGSILIDCGLGRGGRLGCLRLEDGKEFYV